MLIIRAGFSSHPPLVGELAIYGRLRIYSDCSEINTINFGCDMIISTLSNKKSLISFFQKHLVGVDSHQAKLNKIAQLNGIQSWGELSRILSNKDFTRLDRILNSEIKSSASWSMFSLNPENFELVISEFITMHTNKEDRLTYLRICNLFVICSFEGLHTKLQDHSSKYLSDMTLDSTCSLASLNVSKMSAEQLICNICYLLKYGLKIIRGFDSEMGVEIRPSTAVHSTLQGVNYVSRNIELTTKIAVKYAKSYQDEFIRDSVSATSESFEMIFNGHEIFEPELGYNFHEVIETGPQDCFYVWVTEIGLLIVNPLMKKPTAMHLKAYEIWMNENTTLIDHNAMNRALCLS